jgi:hypothetical protein
MWRRWWRISTTSPGSTGFLCILKKAYLYVWTISLQTNMRYTVPSWILASLSPSHFDDRKNPAPKQNASVSLSWTSRLTHLHYVSAISDRFLAMLRANVPPHRKISTEAENYCQNIPCTLTGREWGNISNYLESTMHHLQKTILQFTFEIKIQCFNKSTKEVHPVTQTELLGGKDFHWWH